MNKKTYLTPKTEDINSLKKSTDVQDSRKVGSIIRGITEKQLSNLFSNGIYEDTKRHSDILDLREIKGDIDNHEKYSDIDSIPSISFASQWQAIINSFSDVKEENIGETINFGDIPKEIDGIEKCIKIFQPQNNGSLEALMNKIGFKSMIKIIRNGIMHNRSIITENGLYIHMKNALKKKQTMKDKNGKNIKDENGKDICKDVEQDFEAIIEPRFFLKIINFCLSSTRKPKRRVLNKNDTNKKGFEMGKIQLKKKDTELFNDRISGFGALNDKEHEIQYQIEKLSDVEGEFILEYINKDRPENDKLKRKDRDRNDKLKRSKYLKDKNNRRNLLYLIAIIHRSNELFEIRSTNESMSIDKYFSERKDEISKELIEIMHIKDPGLLSFIRSFYEGKVSTWKIWEDDSEIENAINDNKSCSKNAKEILKDIILSIKNVFLNVKNEFNLKLDSRKNYLKVLYLSKFYVNNPKFYDNPNSELAKPVKRVGNDLRKRGRNFIKDECERIKKERNEKIYWSNEAKKIQMRGKVGRGFRETLLENLTKGHVDEWIIKNTEDVNKIMEMDQINQFITSRTKKLSVADQQILADNVKNVIKDWKEKLDYVTIIGEEEHIRNAFAHHNYAILPGFNKILLWDPSIDDNPNWGKIYDLNELYQNAVNRVDEDYLDKKN